MDLLDNYEHFDLFGHMSDDIFGDVEDFAIMENMELKRALEETETKLMEQELIIKELKKRVSALESAVLWCGESCFDELATDKSSGFVKIK